MHSPMQNAIMAAPAESLHVFALKAILVKDMPIQVDGILALEELVRRAQVEEQRQAMEQATRRALGE